MLTEKEAVDRIVRAAEKLEADAVLINDLFSFKVDDPGDIG